MVLPVAPKDKEVAKVMNVYWTNFAKTGDPNGGGLPQWPVYNPKKNELIEFKLMVQRQVSLTLKKQGWM
jgi:carboxylesterase type B